MVNIAAVLCYAWELRTSLNIVASPTANEALNIPLPELRPKDKSKAIIAAVNQGLLKVRRRRDSPGLPPRNWEDAEWLMEALDQKISPGEILLLELTSKGGRYWEGLARPDWSAYLTEGEPVDYHGTVWIGVQAGSFELAEQARERISPHFETTSVRCSFVRPLETWRPLYWKRLSFGHELWMDTGVASDSSQGKLLRQGLAMANEEAASDLSTLYQEWHKRVWLELQSVAPGSK